MHDHELQPLALGALAPEARDVGGGLALVRVGAPGEELRHLPVGGEPVQRGGVLGPRVAQHELAARGSRGPSRVVAAVPGAVRESPRPCRDAYIPAHQTPNREEAPVQTWDTRSIDVEPHQPQVLHSGDEGRTIVINLPAGEELQDHQVHERAWILVVDGEVEIEAGGETVTGGPGLPRADGARTSATRCARCRTRGWCWCSLPGPARTSLAARTARPAQRCDARAALRHPRQPAGARGGDRGCAGGGRGRVRARRRLRAGGRLAAGDGEARSRSSTRTGSAGNTERWLEEPVGRARRRAGAPRDRVLPRHSSAASAPRSCSGCPSRLEIDGALRLPRLAAQRHADLHAGADRTATTSCSPTATREVVIFGHSHLQFAREAEGGRLLVNPGSVGLPFDGDRRAAYALWHGGREFELRRVEYDSDGYVRAGARAHGRDARRHRRDAGAADRAGRLRRLAPALAAAVRSTPWPASARDRPPPPPAS